MVSEKLLKLYRALDNVPKVLSYTRPPNMIRVDFEGEKIVLKDKSGSLTYIASITDGDDHLEARVTYEPCSNIIETKKNKGKIEIKPSDTSGNTLEGIKRTLSSSIRF